MIAPDDLSREIMIEVDAAGIVTYRKRTTRRSGALPVFSVRTESEAARLCDRLYEIAQDRRGVMMYYIGHTPAIHELTDGTLTQPLRDAYAALLAEPRSDAS